jgi:ABC-type phosphate transport system substrate-binding protein
LFTNRATAAPGATNTAAAWWSTDDAPTAAQLATIEADNPAAGNQAGETVTIPLAAGAITVIVNVPDVCAGTLSGLDEHGRVEITNANIEDVFRGADTTWGQIVTTNNMACSEFAISPKARRDSSGTTFQFKGWLFTQDAANVIGTDDWADLQGQNTTWPAAVTKPATDGGTALATEVFNTDGAIGYVVLADARDGGFWDSGTDDKYWVELQGNGGSWVDPSLNASTGLEDSAETSSRGTSNCTNAVYKVHDFFNTNPAREGLLPLAGHSEFQWSLVDGYNTAVNGVYPICALTYGVAWANAVTATAGTGLGNHTEGQACAVRHYLGYVLRNGQTILNSNDYAALSAGVKTVAEANQEEIMETHITSPTNPCVG